MRYTLKKQGSEGISACIKQVLGRLWIMMKDLRRVTFNGRFAVFRRPPGKLLQAQTGLSVLATYVADCDLSRVTIP